MCFIPLSGAQVQAELVSPHGAHNLSVRQHVYHTVLPMACQEAALSCGDKKTSLAWGKGGSEKRALGDLDCLRNPAAHFRGAHQGALPGKEVGGPVTLVQDGLDSVFYGVGLLAQTKV